MTTTLDPGTVNNGTLSNGNLTFTHDGSTTDGGAPSTTNKVTASGGKFYFEVTTINIGGGDWGFGFCLTGNTASQFGNAVSNSVVLFSSNNVWRNGSNLGGSGNAAGPAAGNTIGVLIDFTNNRFRFDNVTAGTIGTFFTLPTETSFVARVNDNSATGAFTLNFGNSAFVGTIPAGFISWDGVAPPTPTTTSTICLS